MATLPGLVLRSASIAALAFAIAGLPAGTARAQSAGAAPENTTQQTTSEQPAGGSNEVKPVAAPIADSGASAAEGAATAHAKTPGSGLYDIHRALQKFHGIKRPGDDVFERASDSFPAFCKDWGRKLHDRELNNLEHMTWKDKDGYKTGTYLSYSPIKTCLTKRSTGGVPIGELTYQETEFFLEGKTIDQARHAQPKTLGITHTTEIFRWDKNKWVY